MYLLLDDPAAGSRRTPQRIAPWGIAAVILGFLLPSMASARTWYVYLDGSGDAPFIQAAVDSAQDGDVVEVGPGNYPEDYVLIREKSIEIRSYGGPSATTVKHMYAFMCDAVSVSGFTIEGGEQDTGGFFGLDVGEMLLENCIIRGFHRHSIVEDVNDAVVRDCVFEENVMEHAGGFGGGALEITLVPQTPGVQVVGCSFLNNETTGGVPGSGWGGGGAIGANGSYQGSEIVIRDCLFDGNQGRSAGAIFAVGNVSIFHNTFVYNESQDAAVVTLDTPLQSHGVLHNIFAYNTHFGLLANGYGRCGCNAYWENTGGTIQGGCRIGRGSRDFLDIDPLFCDPTAGDYRLAKGSPFVGPFEDDDHLDCEGPIGAFGPGCAPTPTVETSWGSIKAKYGPAARGR